MIETNKQREKRLKAEAPLRAKRAADYARKMAEDLPHKANAVPEEVTEPEPAKSKQLQHPIYEHIAKYGTWPEPEKPSVCPHCGGSL